jgi:hypothetical protein
MTARAVQDAQRADRFEEQFNRRGEIDRRGGDIKVRIQDTLVLQRRDALADIAQHAVKAVLAEFGELPKGHHRFDVAVAFGRPSGCTGLGGDGLDHFTDVGARITRANESIQKKLLTYARDQGLSATVSVIWDNK